MRAKIGRVVVSKELLDREEVREVLDRLQREKPSLEIHPQRFPEVESSHGGLQKDTLYLLEHKGKFLKPCPGTPGTEYICCGYQILHVGTNCPLDCSYCILQGYFNQPGLRAFLNIEEGLGHVLKEVSSRPTEVFRLGTGEFTDSLALDHVLNWSGKILPRVSGIRNLALELKTKTVEIEGILKSKLRQGIIVSWSINSPYVCGREEKGAAPLKKRILAAKKCQEEGFAIGFHFDPMLYHSNWKEGYSASVELLSKHIDPKRVVWISMGSFRFPPNLKPIILSRHPSTKIFDGEFVRAPDGKMRYFKPLRVELYGFMSEKLKTWSSDLCLYLCMESSDVWENALGWSPSSSEELARYLDRRVKTIFKWH